MRRSLTLLLLTILSVFAATRSEAGDSEPYHEPEYYMQPLDENHPNTRIWHEWVDELGRKKILYSKKLEYHFGELYVRTIETNGTVTDSLIEGNTEARVNDEGGWTPGSRANKDIYVFKNDPATGTTYRLLVTKSKDWPKDQTYEVGAPSFRAPIDPERHLLRLQTADGVEFPSFYYEPRGNACNGSPKVALIMDGDGTKYLAYPNDPNDFVDMPTVDHLRDQGYYVLLPNFRGRTELGKDFRLQGVGHLHDLGIKDVVTALDALNREHKFDPEHLVVIGHSRGGQMAGLLATRLGEQTEKYKIAKTIISSGVLNPVDGYYNFYQGIHGDISPANLDFVSDHITDAALGWRPEGKFTDKQWEQIQQIEKAEYRDFYKRNFSSNSEYQTGEFRFPKRYFDQSPFHHVQSLQGEVLAFVDERETGSTSPQGVLQFQKAAGEDRVKVVLHQFGHGWEVSDKEAMKTWFSKIDDFLTKDSNRNCISGQEATGSKLSQEGNEAHLDKPAPRAGNASSAR